MVNLIYSSGTGYCEYAGLSTDNKPTVGVGNGSIFTEVDTGDEYAFNFDSTAWVKQPKEGGGGTPTLQSKTATPTTSQQTIQPDEGYDGLSSVTVNAISPTKSAETFTPTTSDQTIAADRWLTGAQTIKGDANLVAGNIKKDVSIFSVVGTYEGSGSSAYTLIAEDELVVSTTSTSATGVGTVSAPGSYQMAKIVYVKIRDKAGKRSGYFYGSDSFIIGSSTTCVFRYVGTNSYGGSTSTTAVGVFANSVDSSNVISIRAKYSSGSSETIDGTFVVQVYLLEWPNNVSPIN